MKRLVIRLTYLCIILLFSAACNQDDIDLLKRQQQEMEERLRLQEEAVRKLRLQLDEINGALNDMQTLLLALENRDYISNIVPIVENGIEVGYTIVFAQSRSISIYNGKDGAAGADGKDAVMPLLSLKMHSDGVFYWCQKLPDGTTTFILDEQGNMVQATDLSGKSAYELAQDQGYTGSLAEWLESLKGESAYTLAVENGFSGTEQEWLETLKGATPIIGIKKDTDGEYYWTCKLYGQQENFIRDAVGNKIKATGEKGEQGSGACIFAPNGVDLSNPEVVIFTLADGVTKITLPRQATSAASITFGAFSDFQAGGASQTVSYQVASGRSDVQIKAIDKPAEWAVRQDAANSTLTVDPQRFGGDVGMHTLSLLISFGTDDTLVKTISVNILPPEVGTIFFEHGVSMGLVVRAKSGDTPSTRGLIMHKNDAGEGLKWAQNSYLGWDYQQEVRLAAGMPNQGESYLKAVMGLSGDWSARFPAFNWCYNLGEGWFLPTTDDMASIDSDTFSIIYFMLPQLPGADPLTDTKCESWCCDNSYGVAMAQTMTRMLSGVFSNRSVKVNKNVEQKVRAFRAF